MTGVKNLIEQYRNSRFLYHFLLRRTPCGAAVFGVSLMKLCELLIPFLLLVLFENGMAYSHEWGLLIPLLAVIGVLWLYGLWVFAEGCAGWCRLFTANPFKAAILGGLIALILAFFSLTDWWISVAVIAVFAFLKCVEKKHTSMALSFTPLGILILLIIICTLWQSILQSDCQHYSFRFTEKMHRQPRINTLDSSGFYIGREPMVSMIRKKFEVPEIPEAISQQAARAQLKKLESQYADCIQGLQTFLTFPVSYFDYPTKQNALHPVEAFSEIPVMIACARFLALKMIACSTDLKMIRTCSDSIRQLRNWMMSGLCLKSRIAGMKIEQIRIKTIQKIFLAGKISREEKLALLGTPLDWKRLLADASMDDLSIFMLSFPHQWMAPVINVKTYYFLRTGFPMFSGIQSLREMIFCYQNYALFDRFLETGVIPKDFAFSKKAFLYGCLYTVESMKQLDQCLQQWLQLQTSYKMAVK